MFVRPPRHAISGILIRVPASKQKWGLSSHGSNTGAWYRVHRVLCPSFYDIPGIFRNSHWHIHFLSKADDDNHFMEFRKLEVSYGQSRGAASTQSLRPLLMSSFTEASYFCQATKDGSLLKGAVLFIFVSLLVVLAEASLTLHRVRVCVQGIRRFLRSLPKGVCAPQYSLTAPHSPESAFSSPK